MPLTPLPPLTSHHSAPAAHDSQGALDALVNACSSSDWEGVHALCTPEVLQALPAPVLGQWMLCISQYSQLAVNNAARQLRYALPAPEHVGAERLANRDAAHTIVSQSGALLQRMAELPAAQALGADVLDHLLPVAAFRADRTLSNQLLRLAHACDVHASTLHAALRGALTHDDAHMLDLVLQHPRFQELDARHISDLLCMAIRPPPGQTSTRHWTSATLQTFLNLPHASEMDASQIANVLWLSNSVPVKSAVVQYPAFQTLTAEHLQTALQVNFACEPIALAILGHHQASHLQASVLGQTLSQTPSDSVRQAVLAIANTHHIALRSEELAATMGATASRAVIQQIGELAIQTEVDIDFAHALHSPRGHLAAQLMACALLMQEAPQRQGAILHAMGPLLTDVERLFPLETELQPHQWVTRDRLEAWSNPERIQGLARHALAMMGLGPDIQLVQSYQEALINRLLDSGLVISVAPADTQSTATGGG